MHIIALIYNLSYTYHIPLSIAKMIGIFRFLNSFRNITISKTSIISCKGIHRMICKREISIRDEFIKKKVPPSHANKKQTMPESDSKWKILCINFVQIAFTCNISRNILLHFSCQSRIDIRWKCDRIPLLSDGSFMHYNGKNSTRIVDMSYTWLYF